MSPTEFEGRLPIQTRAMILYFPSDTVTAILRLALTGVVACVVANLCIKSWQRYVRCITGVAVTGQASAWSVLSAYLRIWRAHTCTGKPQWVKDEGPHVSKLEDCHSWYIGTNSRGRAKKRRIIDYALLHLECVLAASTEVLLCVAVKISLLLYAVARVLGSAELRGIELAYKQRRQAIKSAKTRTDRKHQLKKIHFVFIRHGYAFLLVSVAGSLCLQRIHVE